MAFEILRPVSPSGSPLFDRRKDRRTGCRCSFEVSIEIEGRLMVCWWRPALSEPPFDASA
jgi:hypothetical protein